MERLLTPSQMRSAEKISDMNGVSYSQLMDNAGLKLADIIKSNARSRRKITFLCGKGNNAGDCFVAAKHLKKDGFDISIVLLCGQPQSELAVKNFNIIKDSVYVSENPDAVRNSDIVADGVFGTGFKGKLDDSMKNIFENIPDSALKIAVDVPSGGNSLSGAVSDGTFKADITVTFGLPKFGMYQYPLNDFCGRIITADIGFTENVIENAADIPIYRTSSELVHSNILPRKNNSHKGNFGKLLSICGSTRMSGACMMAGKAALKCGAGILITASPEKSADRTALYLPEGMTLPLESDKDGFALYDENICVIKQYLEKSSAVLIGCGLGVTPDTVELVCDIVKNAPCPVIIDADGINCIADRIEILKEAKYMPVLTPHPAEMARLMQCCVNDIQNDRFNAAVSFAKKYNAAVALKGAGTVIASPECVFVNNTGNPGMSRGGSGDVLAGMTASFRCQGFDAVTSAAMAVYIHGKAGDIAREKFSECAMLPTDIISSLSDVFKNQDF